MENDEDMEIDPAIAASMGFSSFGTQPGKRRKIDSHDNSVDRSVPGAKNTSKGKAASTSLAGENMDKNIARPCEGHGGMEHTGVVATTQGGLPLAVDARSSLATRTSNEGSNDNGQPSLEALRNGVRNANGDMVYFLPSFLEDPWRDLKPK